MDTTLLHLLAATALSASVGLLGYLLVAVELEPVALTGSRGQAREDARESSILGTIEPLVRIVAAHFSRLAWAGRHDLQQRLVRGGDYLGLSADEFQGLRVLSAVVAAVGAALVWKLSASPFLSLFALLLGLVLPDMRLNEAIQKRRKAIDRGLPTAIDLAAMCMSAGMDFPGAIAQVATNMHGRCSPMRQELERILQELSLGRTRKQALQAFASRVDTEAVAEFVNAVILSEEKGTPLSQVLSIQAETLRIRRSVMAEEAAAKAGVMMMIPLMMMFGCIGLLLMGPLIIQAMEGGF